MRTRIGLRALEICGVAASVLVITSHPTYAYIDPGTGSFVLQAALAGLLGVAFGVGGAKLVGNANDWTIVLLPSTIILAFSFSAIVGAFFGFYPAWKASRLNPIEALRYE